MHVFLSLHECARAQGLYKPKSEVPAFLEVVDIAGLVKGASAGAGLGNAFLSNIRAVDGIMHVCRCFEDKVRLVVSLSTHARTKHSHETQIEDLLRWSEIDMIASSSARVMCVCEYVLFVINECNSSVACCSISMLACVAMTTTKKQNT